MPQGKGAVSLLSTLNIDIRLLKAPAAAGHHRVALTAKKENLVSADQRRIGADLLTEHCLSAHMVSVEE